MGKKSMEEKEESDNFFSSQFPRSRAIPFSSSNIRVQRIRVQRRFVVMRAILFVTRRKGGLLSVVGGAWTRTLRLTSPRNVRTIRVLTISKPLLYVQHVAGSNVYYGYMVIGQTHVHPVQRMIACYLLTSGAGLRYRR